MANPMTAAQLVSALKRWGVTVIEHAGWETNNRNHVGAWGPVHGSMVHHTASSDGMGIVELCYNGRSDLQGPLCTGVIAKNGTVYLVGNGRANHAGSGSTAALNSVIDDDPVPYPPGPDAVDGNARFYGWEAVNLGDGKDPWPEVQLDAIARVQAAVCEYHTWSAQSVIGHLEWTARKIDPRGFAMAHMRARVTKHLTAGPTLMEEDMALTADDIDQFWAADIIPAARPPYNNADYADGNLTWSAKYAERAAVEAARESVARIKEVQAAIAAAEPQPVNIFLTDAQVEAIATNPRLAEAIAEHVAAKLAARLAS
jgi:hypothetical protein